MLLAARPLCLIIFNRQSHTFQVHFIHNLLHSMCQRHTREGASVSVCHYNSTTLPDHFKLTDIPKLFNCILYPICCIQHRYGFYSIICTKPNKDKCVKQCGQAEVMGKCSVRVQCHCISARTSRKYSIKR